MELKSVDDSISGRCFINLLIVPYGIEIGVALSPFSTFRLLIVPYGIEMDFLPADTAGVGVF